MQLHSCGALSLPPTRAPHLAGQRIRQVCLDQQLVLQADQLLSEVGGEHRGGTLGRSCTAGAGATAAGPQGAGGRGTQLLLLLLLLPAAGRAERCARRALAPRAASQRHLQGRSCPWLLLLLAGRLVSTNRVLGGNGRRVRLLCVTFSRQCRWRQQAVCEATSGLSRTDLTRGWQLLGCAASCLEHSRRA